MAGGGCSGFTSFLLVLPALTLLAVAAFPITLLVARDSQVFGISMAVLYTVTFFSATVELLRIRTVPEIGRARAVPSR